jgi:phosphatidate cytidylyltransferase
VAGADDARRAYDPDRGKSGRNEPIVRILSAAVMAPLAIGAAYVGGWPFAVFWGIAAIGVWWEWATLSAGSAGRVVFMAGAGALIGAALAVIFGPLWVALLWLAAGAVGVAMLARSGSPLWIGSGVLYAGAALVAPVALRSDPQHGFAAVLFLFAVVWATDIMAYFAGRMVGGPKLAPRLSPRKTWSGAAGGAAGAVIAAAMVGLVGDLGHWTKIALIGFALSCVSQAGDLFESAFKRWYGAKDAGRLIPGHGGLMDRLDGFIAAAVVAAIVGILRGGTEAPARGLLVW